MGHREEVEPISYLAPRTELSAQRDIFEVILGVMRNTKKSVLHFKDASHLQYDWSVESRCNCIHCFPHSAAIAAQRDWLLIKRYLAYLFTWKKERLT